MRNMTSRLALAAVLAGSLAVGLVAPALADVDVVATIDKEKTVTVNETISITKTVTLFARIGDEEDALLVNGAAEAQALANVTNVNNTLDYNDNDVSDTDFSSVITNSSLNGNTGVVGVNQDSGNFANQGNALAVGLADSGDAFANSQAEADQVNSNNVVDLGIDHDLINENQVNALPAENAGQIKFLASIESSTLSNNIGLGVVGLNQNAGNANNQLNLVAVAAGLDTTATDDTTVALSEAALGQTNGGSPEGGNVVRETGTNKVAQIIGGSLSGNFGGVIGVNQAAGNNANQANLVSVSASLAGLPE